MVNCTGNNIAVIHTRVALRVPSGNSLKATSRIFVVRGKGSEWISAMELAKIEAGLLNARCLAAESQVVVRKRILPEPELSRLWQCLGFLL